MIKIGAKASDFFETHVEKVVLGIVGLVCIWLFSTRVLFSPNVVVYEDKPFSPSEIDPYIREQAQNIEVALKQPAESEPTYDPCLPAFNALMACAMGDIDPHVRVPLPDYTLLDVAVNRKYDVPEIGDVTEVAMEHIRAAAYVPVVPITPQNSYDQGNSEPNDIDLVTVEAKYDVVELYKEFHRCYASEDVPIEWRDPCLAVPVFAAVHLQRQELLGDGAWSDWQTVPRAQIDPRKRMFEIIENVENLPPGGMKVQLLQFDNPDVRIDLLQPMAYQIASANQEWFPPSLHKKFVDLQRKEKLEEKRKALAEEKEKEDSRQDYRRDRRSGGTTATRYGSGRSTTGPYQGYQDTTAPSGSRERRPRRSRFDRGIAQGDAGLSDVTGPYTGPGDAGRRPRRRGREPELDVETQYLMGAREISTEPTSGDVYYDFEDVLIRRRTNLAKLREPLLFWAHDDTAEPGQTYRYRIRLGVFNPVAGANPVSKPGGSHRSQVILWSDFSDITESAEIPERLYFFANNVQPADKTVTVQVSKYLLGYWRSKEFRVNPGEAIGKVVETEPPEDKNRIRGLRGTLAMELGSMIPVKERSATPEEIDYNTGAVLVDAVPVSDWAGPGQLSPRPYHDMLYTYDGTDIERMAVKIGNWPEKLVAAFYDIKRAERETPEPFRDWSTQLAGRKPRTTILDGYEGMEEEYMMMEEMMMMQQGRR